MKFEGLPPLSLYVHIPWCERKCPYCDFNSHQTQSSLPEDAYVNALIVDLEQEIPSIWGRTVVSVFIGGGTPSLFSAAAINRLLSAIRQRVNLVPGAEISMEVNPGSAELDRLAGYCAAGVNRFSVGIQSFNNSQLKSLGRVHDREAALQAVDKLQRVGIGNFNLDMMFGLPGQSADDAQRDVDELIRMGAPHLSYYQLTIEPNTYFNKFPPVLPVDDELMSYLEQAQSSFSHAHYRQYEVSAYSLVDHECQHNLNYWKFGDYLGIGAGAHGKLSMGSDSSIRRARKHRKPETYIAQHNKTSSFHPVDEKDVVFEVMMNVLRLKNGIDKDTIIQRSGLSWSRFEQDTELALSKKLLEDTKTRIQPTELGWRFLNDLIALYLPE